MQYCGVGVAAWFVISNLILIIVRAYFDGIFSAGSAFVIALALFLGWRIWKKAGYISSILLLIWVVIEAGFKLIVRPGGGIVISIIMLICAIHGVRGTLKNRFGNGNYLQSGK